jgi:hypothetical protein
VCVCLDAGWWLASNIQTKSVNNRKTVKTVMTLTWYRHFKRNGGLNPILKRQNLPLSLRLKVSAVTITVFTTILGKIVRSSVILFSLYLLYLINDTKRIRHKFYQLMESSPIHTIIITLCWECTWKQENTI